MQLQYLNDVIKSAIKYRQATIVASDVASLPDIYRLCRNLIPIDYRVAGLYGNDLKTVFNETSDVVLFTKEQIQNDALNMYNPYCFFINWSDVQDGARGLKEILEAYKRASCGSLIFGVPARTKDELNTFIDLLDLKKIACFNSGHVVYCTKDDNFIVKESVLL